ncbi:proteasome endopeptidase complex beta subunit [Mycena metata]|uniref:Proteasome endopeptidase complex beta subunit n=1 Tax=Mycena metata TaxID=1033252 RepID=A0AAD7I1H7_9AGAR|nr:proteasome endopeptidase complex beta subunit [Mycena metata]
MPKDAVSSTRQSIVTGTSVLAIKFGRHHDGFRQPPTVLACFRAIQRLHVVQCYWRSDFQLQDEAALEFAGCRGFKRGKRFLGFVDLLGTTYSASTLATGYGAHIAQPCCDTLEEDEARKIIEQSMRCSSTAMLAVSTSTTTITAAGVHISKSRKLETSWGFAEGI